MKMAKETIQLILVPIMRVSVCVGIISFTLLFLVMANDFLITHNLYKPENTFGYHLMGYSMMVTMLYAVWKVAFEEQERRQCT